VGELAAGAAATLQFAIIHTAGGWHLNQATVTAFEPDLDLTNNLSRLVVFVEPALSGNGVMALTVEDMLYDPVRDRLLLSVTNGNGIAVLNPYTAPSKRLCRWGAGLPAWLAPTTGSSSTFHSRTRAGAAAAASHAGVQSGIFRDTGPGSAGLRSRLGCSSRTIRFCGGLSCPFIHPHLWGIRPGVAIFDNGVIRTNIAWRYDPYGQDWNIYGLEFDPATATLYAYSHLITHRCEIDSRGVAYAATLPVVASGNTADLKYAAGRFFTAQGRGLSLSPFSVRTSTPAVKVHRWSNRTSNSACSTCFATAPRAS